MRKLLKKFGIKARPSKFQIGNRTPGDRLPETHGSWKGGKQVVQCDACGKDLKRRAPLLLIVSVDALFNENAPKSPLDDFLFDQWANFEQAMRKVLPMARFVRLDQAHPIFDAFFRIASLDGLYHPGTPEATAQYYGIYEDNDPAKRLMVIVNYNNDIGDYMEWSGQGWYPVNMSNDAYKFATNYIIYGLTR